MIKLIHILEKSKTFWFLLIIFIIFFLLRLPSVIEPNWYGDEGIYQIIGRAVDNGRMLYSQAWDNKPPLLYLTYALFHGDHFSMRFLSLVIGLFTTGMFFALSQIIFKNLKTSIITTSVFTFIFATPLIEGNIANAENFMLLPIIAAALIIYKISNNHASKPYTLNPKPLLLTGLLLGIAFLFKIVAIFDLAAFLCFLIIVGLPEEFSLFRKHESKIKIHVSWLFPLLRDSAFLLIAFFLPLLISIIYFAINNTLGDFIQATFSGMFGYVGYRNSFIIPQGFLILKLLLLSSVLLFCTVKRKHVSRPILFILIWISFSLFNALFSQRPYTHYMLVLLPSFCLYVGLLFHTKIRKQQTRLLLLFIAILAIIFTNFKTYNLKKMVLYYQNAFLFMTNQKDVSSYQTFFDHKTPRDYAIAGYIRMHSNINDPLFIWGDSAQIYTLSNTLPINKYTVAYHIRQNKKDIEQTQQDINAIQPKFVIILPESQSFPFRLDNYVNKYIIDKAAIYERTF